jgi:hypothetical protein
MRCTDTAAAAVLTAVLAVSPHGAALAQVQPSDGDFAESVIHRAKVWISSIVTASLTISAWCAWRTLGRETVAVCR